MSGPQFEARVTDFERAPWLPCIELAKERDFLANNVAEDVARGWMSDRVVRDAQAVHLMRQEDLRILIEYGAAYREWKTSVAA